MGSLFFSIAFLNAFCRAGEVALCLNDSIFYENENLTKHESNDATQLPCFKMVCKKIVWHRYLVFFSAATLKV